MIKQAYLLDANVVFHLANKAEGWQNIEQRMLQVPARSMLLSSIAAFELGLKINTGPGRIRKEAIQKASSYLRRFKILPFTERDASMGALVAGELQAVGQGIGWKDAMISGIALIHNLIVVTDNIGEFERVPTLDVENWRRAGAV